MNIFVSWPGSCHDARILANSSIFAKAEEGSLLPTTTENINGVAVPVVILGDPAHSLLLWLIKPFSSVGQLTREKRCFNYHLSRARVVVECAFGRLKGCWRCLLKRNDTNLSFLPTLVTSCCILHNLCEVHSDGFNDDWMCEDDEIDNTAPNPHPPNVLTITSAENIRTALCRYFA